jgi:hypothetical protein
MPVDHQNGAILTRANAGAEHVGHTSEVAPASGSIALPLGSAGLRLGRWYLEDAAQTISQ